MLSQNSQHFVESWLKVIISFLFRLIGTVNRVIIVQSFICSQNSNSKAVHLWHDRFFQSLPNINQNDAKVIHFRSLLITCSPCDVTIPFHCSTSNELNMYCTRDMFWWCICLRKCTVVASMSLLICLACLYCNPSRLIYRLHRNIWHFEWNVN